MAFILLCVWFLLSFQFLFRHWRIYLSSFLFLYFPYITHLECIHENVRIRQICIICFFFHVDTTWIFHLCNKCFSTSENLHLTTFCKYVFTVSKLTLKYFSIVRYVFFLFISSVLFCIFSTWFSFSPSILFHFIWIHSVDGCVFDIPLSCSM